MGTKLSLLQILKILPESLPYKKESQAQKRLTLFDTFYFGSIRRFVITPDSS